MNETPKITKTLVTCNCFEFAAQSVRIERAVKGWLTATDIQNIRKRLPTLEKATSGMTVDEIASMKERNATLLKKQQGENLAAIFNAVLAEHPKETFEIVGLCCFIEPDELSNYQMRDLMGAISDLISDEVVIRFFISLVHLGNTITSGISKA